jgi:hypothetical protein
MADCNHDAFVGLIETLKQNIKAFNGDVYGNILTFNESDYQVLAELSNQLPTPQLYTIQCRVDLYLFTVFVQVLNLNFDVQCSPMQFSETMGINKQYIISPKLSRNETKPRVVLDVCYQSTLEWTKFPCDFDIHLLAENSSSVFLKSNYMCLDRFVDKIGHIKKRVEQRKFTVLDSTACRTSEKLRMLIDRSQTLIRRGWLMDDMLYGDEVWNINLWLTYLMRPQACRIFHDKKKRDVLVSLNECPVCNDKFQPEDIVINSRCNHNFHWRNSRCGGLSEWLKRGNISCPICRKNAL